MDVDESIPGVRRIANWFNAYIQNRGKNISIGKSRVHEILASAGIFEKEKKITGQSIIYLAYLIYSIEPL